MRLLASCAFILSGLLTALLPRVGEARDDSPTNVGEAIFRRGVLGSGEVLVASHASGIQMRGQDAACVNCHRRSGLGMSEGRSSIPPITGRYLFRPRARNHEDLDLPYVEGVRADREPYTDATVARAIREGLNSEGRPLSDVMPRFALNDSDMAALVSYLKNLDQRNVPGVSETVLHFATIVTPDADPVKRRGMLDVLEHYFAANNILQRRPTPPLRSTRMLEFMVHRKWQLHVWELSGAPATWQEQLERHLANEPVLAVVSGLGGKIWAPVHGFCEQANLPCFFPNVEVPVDAAGAFYSLYLSKGVLLEAELIASRILDSSSGKRAQKVHQIYRTDDSGESGAHALAALLKAGGITVVSHVIAPGLPKEKVTEALREAVGADALALWLRPADVALLGGQPTGHAAMFLSGLMGGLEHSPLPSDWRERTLVTYPFDLPASRRTRVDYPLRWFSIHHIPLVAEQVQVDTFLACGLLAEALNRVINTFVRDYLVERAEGAPEHLVMTGYYPRLSLGPGQRFASRGGYLVRFSGAEGTGLTADQDWLVP